LGRLFNVREAAIDLVANIEYSYAQLPGLKRVIPYLCLVWRKPWIGVGTNTYIDSVLSCSGLTNCLQESDSRYPELTEDQIVSSGAELVILPNEPYPFSNKHIPEIKELLNDAEIRLIDGQMISWFGIRMLWAGDYLCSWLKGLRSGK
jgi:hypothetical protein